MMGAVECYLLDFFFFLFLSNLPPFNPWSEIHLIPIPTRFSKIKHTT